MFKLARLIKQLETPREAEKNISLFHPAFLAFPILVLFKQNIGQN